MFNQHHKDLIQRANLNDPILIDLNRKLKQLQLVEKPERIDAWAIAVNAVLKQLDDRTSELFEQQRRIK